VGYTDHDAGLVEALLRWHNPVLGQVSPARFIPVAEDSGLILAIGAWVLEESCRQIALWLQRYNKVIRVAVNIASIQLERADFVTQVADVLARHRLHPAQLELELTERMIVRDVAATKQKMSELKALGVRLAIDDFGAGHSSLSYLLQLPVDVLKVDRAFVQNLNHVAGAERVIEAVVALAHALQLTVVAEGVETEAQRREITTLGCELAQGFLLGRPMTVQSVEELLALGEKELNPVAMK
jgi:EAL domain-containing protein (putative c-di-GMP-specific phosphodiesterase class I)